MKLLILLLAVLAGVWLWRRGRRLERTQEETRQNDAKALPMVRCLRCGVHVPGNEVVPGRQGSYCSVTHREESESA